MGERLTNGLNRQWILEFTFDPLAACVRIVLTANPDRGTKDREIVVGQILNFHAERYHDAEGVCLGDFSGINIARHGQCWRYSMDTGDAKITFDSPLKAEFAQRK